MSIYLAAPITWLLSVPVGLGLSRALHWFEDRKWKPFYEFMENNNV